LASAGELRAALLALALSGAGGLVKLYGGARSGSLAVLADGVTCVANLAAGAAVLVALRIASAPADEDHPFGHRRYQYTGLLAVLIAYSAALGFNIALLLLASTGRTVEAGGALYALVGGALYGGSVLYARRAGVAGRGLSMFTMSEVLESALSAGGALGGALVSPLLDTAGAAVITGYIVVELVGEARDLNRVLVDWAHPRVYREVYRLLSERGLRVIKLRVRLLEHGRYHGDAVVAPERGMPRDVAELLLDEAIEEARRLGVDLVATIAPERRG